MKVSQKYIFCYENQSENESSNNVHIMKSGYVVSKSLCGLSDIVTDDSIKLYHKTDAIRKAADIKIEAISEAFTFAKEAQSLRIGAINNAASPSETSYLNQLEDINKATKNIKDICSDCVSSLYGKKAFVKACGSSNIASTS